MSELIPIDKARKSHQNRTRFMDDLPIQVCNLLLINRVAFLLNLTIIDNSTFQLFSMLKLKDLVNTILLN